MWLELSSNVNFFKWFYRPIRRKAGKLKPAVVGTNKSSNEFAPAGNRTGNLLTRRQDHNNILFHLMKIFNVNLNMNI